MIRLPPRSTRTDTLFPYTTLFRSQFPLIRDATRAFSLPCIEMAGYEADDLIASYTEAAVREGWDVTIVSSDKDLRSEEHTSELQSLMRISYAVFCLKKKTKNKNNTHLRSLP